MKIPKSEHVYHNSNTAKRLFNDWRAAAAQIEMEYGVWVAVKTEEDTNTIVTRIYFLAMEHEFESLRDLKKALENKAFM